MGISCVSELAELLSDLPEPIPPVPCEGEPKPTELSSSCSRMPPHVYHDHNDHGEDQHSHHEQ
jgi:hypothetical protein